MRRWALGPCLLVLGCTAPEDSLFYEDPSILEAGSQLEFSVRPDHVEPERPTLAQRLDDSAQTNKPRRDPMWGVIMEPGAWLSDHTMLDPCTAELPGFPAVSVDRTVLALAIATAPVADTEAAVVRFYRIADGTLLGSHWLLRPWEAPMLESDPETIHRRYCARADKLAQLIDKELEPMPVVGGWANPIREGLPADAEPWPVVIADGATREVDMAVADIAVTTPEHPQDRLQVRGRGVEECLTDEGQFSKVWATPEVSVFTRGPCGC